MKTIIVLSSMININFVSDSPVGLIFFDYFGRDSSKKYIVLFKRFVDSSISSYGYIVSQCDVAEYQSTRADICIVSNCGSLWFPSACTNVDTGMETTIGSNSGFVINNNGSVVCYR